MYTVASINICKQGRLFFLRKKVENQAKITITEILEVEREKKMYVVLSASGGKNKKRVEMNPKLVKVQVVERRQE